MMRIAKNWHSMTVVGLLFLAFFISGCVPSTAPEGGSVRSQGETATIGPLETSTKPLATPGSTPTISGRATRVPTETAVVAKATETAEIQSTETPLPVPEQESKSSAESEDLEEDVVLVYKRSGGFAGLDEEFTIYANGRITSKDGREWWVEPEQVDLLLAELEQMGFFDLQPSYLPKNPCCDLFFYELSVYSGDQVWTVHTVDGAPGAPDSLWEMLDLVQMFLNQAMAS